jgi:hypothetical protein
MRLLSLGLASTMFMLASQSFAGSSANVFSKVPLRFEAASPNQWVAHGPGFAVAFTQAGTEVYLGDRRVRMTFEESNPSARFVGAQKSATPNNYFGSGASRSVDAFLKLRQEAVYPGIDVVYYGEGEGLEYDFELAPGADPSPIHMRFSGADRISLNTGGELVLVLNGKEVTQKPPVVYQRRDSGEIVSVEASYFTEDDGSVRLKLGTYDRTQKLVIDPLVRFQAYLGGSGSDVPIGIAHDKNNTVYVAGRTYSPDFNQNGIPYTNIFPTSPTAVFVSVLNPLASTTDQIIPYSGFFTGQFGDDLTAMTVDDNGLVYLAGTTGDVLFPVTANAFSKTTGNINAKVFVATLDTTIQGTGGLQYCTFFAGSQTDQATGIATANGKIYLTGFTTSDDFPLANAFQSTRAGGRYDAWVAEIDPTLSGTAGLVFSSYLGGTGEDISRSIALAPDGQIWVGGETFSTDFPTTVGSYRPFYSGGGDAFLARVNPTLPGVTYATYLGGSSQDQAKKILMDPQGRVALTGYTLSSDFPFTTNALQPFLNGTGDVFFTIIDPNAPFTTALAYSTFFGGSDQEVAYDMRRDASGKYYLCGYTLSQDFPVLNALYPVSSDGGGTDGWVAVIDPSQPPSAALIYSSYVTGSGFQVAYSVDVDSNGVIYLVGSAFGNVFAPGRPIPPANSNTNVFFLAFQLDPPPGQSSVFTAPAITLRRPAPTSGTRISARPSTR